MTSQDDEGGAPVPPEAPDVTSDRLVGWLETGTRLSDLYLDKMHDLLAGADLGGSLEPAGHRQVQSLAAAAAATATVMHFVAMSLSMAAPVLMKTAPHQEEEKEEGGSHGAEATTPR